MKLFYVFILASSIITSSAFCQDTINVSKYNPSSFSIDVNGDYFLISGNSLFKLNTKDNTAIEYSNKMYGNISSVDVSNPFKILVFHKETGIINFLDNHLKELQSPISLHHQGLQNVELACNGSDNSFWIFNNDTYQISKLDYKLNTITSTADLSSLYQTALIPKSIVERGGKLFFYVPDFGLLIFYNSGNYLQTLHFSKISHLMPISENQLFYVDSISGPTVMDFTTNTFHKLFKKNTYTSDYQVFYYNDKIFALTGQTIISSEPDDQKSLNETFKKW